MQTSRSRRRRALCAALSLLGSLAAAGADESALDSCRDAVRRDASRALVLCDEAEQAALAAQDARGAGLAAIEHAGAAIALARYDLAAADLARADPRLPDAQWRDRHRLERQRGTLAFRRERLAEAALHYGRSLEIARSHDDIAAQAQGWNDVGIVYRRIGEYAQALEAFTTSLALRERLGETDRAAAVLNNLGNLQQDLGDYAAAQTFLERALAAYRTQDAPRQIAHVLESLGINDRQQGRDADARDRLVQAWDAFTRHDAPRDRLRVATHLARLEARLGDRTAARRWIGEATGLAATLQQTPSLALRLAMAQTDDDAGSRRVLRERLRANLDDPLSERVEAWTFLATASERDGDGTQALDDLKALQTVRTELADTAQNERVAQWQVRLDVANRLREIDALREQNRLQAERLENERLRNYLTLALALGALAFVIAVLRSRLQRQRAQATVQRLALEHQNAQYRSAADALRADRRRLRALADRSIEALLLVDARGSVLAANRAASRLLHRDGDESGAESLAQLLGPEAERLGAAMAARENADEEREEHSEIALIAPDGRSLRASVGLLDEAEAEEPVVWLRLREETPGSAATDAAVTPADAEASEALRRALVELMLATLDAWERSTRLSRVEFAEKSGIWRVHIDDGRLRMRSMERYLSLARLPRHPRWREVLRSAYFVLADCPLTPAQRRLLEERVAAVRAQLSEKALDAVAAAGD